MPRVSVVIPYRARPDNLRLSLGALARQTMPKADYEVVIGTLDVSSEFFGIVASFADRLNIVSVGAEGEWDGPRARNMAMRQATGDVVAFVEADVVVPGDYLERLLEEHFNGEVPRCVMSELIGYADECEVERVALEPLESYLKRLDDLAALPDADRDSRLEYLDPPMYWPLGWGAAIAVTRSAVTVNGAWFNENFAGWGLHDQEWALQLEKAGVQMVFARGLVALHVPHKRTLAENFGSKFKANQKYMLQKWPIKQVELVLAYGWRGGLEHHEDLLRESEALLGIDRDFCVVLCSSGGKPTLIIGAVQSASTGELLTDVSELIDDVTVEKTLPLFGRLLPFDDQSVEKCLILPDVLRLSGRLPMRIKNEAKRVEVDNMIDTTSPEVVGALSDGQR